MTKGKTAESRKFVTTTVTGTELCCDQTYQYPE